MNATDAYGICVGALALMVVMIAFVAVIALGSRRPQRYDGIDAPASRNHGSGFRILQVGPNSVDFYHEEGGTWGYGLTDDLSSVHGVTQVTALGGRRYRIDVDRNPAKAALVLEAAHRFRTEPKAVRGGAVHLNACAGYKTLLDEASRRLD